MVYKSVSIFLFSYSGEYVCEIETYGSPLDQTSTLEILGKCFAQYIQIVYISREKKWKQNKIIAFRGVIFDVKYLFAFLYWFTTVKKCNIYYQHLLCGKGQNNSTLFFLEPLSHEWRLFNKWFP